MNTIGSEALRAVQRPLAEASHAPGFLYASADVYRLEVERLFMRDWLYVARVEELPNPGDYMTVRIAGEPLVIARDQAGTLHACYNMCAHRGVEVAQGCGNAKAFTCPYHGWVYDLAGRLTGAAHMKESESFALGDQRMRPIRLETWSGNVFISFDPEGPPLAEHLREFEKDFAFLGAKFAWEDDHVQLESRGGVAIFYSAGPPTPNAEPLLGKMPWLEDRPVSFSPPNCTLFGRIDCVRLMIAWSDGPNRSRTIIYHLFPEEFFARPGFTETRQVYRDYQLQVLEEDRSMIESMQLAMASPAYRPGRMSTLEKPLHHYVNGYIERVFGS